MYLTSLRIAFRGGVVVMALLSAAKLTDEVIRLVWRSGPNAAVDLKLRYAEVHDWFGWYARHLPINRADNRVRIRVAP